LRFAVRCGSWCATLMRCGGALPSALRCRDALLSALFCPPRRAVVRARPCRPRPAAIGCLGGLMRIAARGEVRSCCGALAPVCMLPLAVMRRSPSCAARRHAPLAVMRRSPSCVV
jgi:hypothetical protein